MSWLTDWLKERLPHTTTWLALMSVGLPIVNALWILVYSLSTNGPHLSYLAVAMLAATAALLVGCLLGFLLGIPKVVSSGQLHQKTGVYTPSTNLSEISDWLTKLLLGAGLVSLSRLGRPISELVDKVAAGLLPASTNPALTQSAKVLACATLIAFTVIGLLDGYVITTTWYQKKIAELADRIDGTDPGQSAIHPQVAVIPQQGGAADAQQHGAAAAAP